MITQTHEALENWVLILSIFTTVGGIGSVVGGVMIAGWKKSHELEKEAANEKIKSLADHQEKQWKQLDELNRNAPLFITRDKHDASLKDIYGFMETAVEKAAWPLRESLSSLASSVARLSDKLDQIILKQKQ